MAKLSHSPDGYFFPGLFLIVYPGNYAAEKLRDIHVPHTPPLEVLCLSTSVAVAQNTETVDLPAGQIRLRQDGLETRVSGAGQQLVLDEAYLPNVRTIKRKTVCFYNFVNA